MEIKISCLFGVVYMLYVNRPRHTKAFLQLRVTYTLLRTLFNEENYVFKLFYGTVLFVGLFVCCCCFIIYLCIYFTIGY